MGKDRSRKKYHSEAVKPSSSSLNEEKMETDVPKLVPVVNMEKLAPKLSTEK